MTRPECGTCLAPFSVLPEAQDHGIGGRLAEANRAEAVVLGDPAFYTRYGSLSAPSGLGVFPVSCTLVAGRGAAVALEHPAAFW